MPARVAVVHAPLRGSGAVDALGSMRNGLQAGGLDVAAAGVALAVAAGADPFQSGVDLGEFAAFDFRELATQLHLLGSERGIQFISHAGFMQILERTYFSVERAGERLATAKKLLLGLCEFVRCVP